MVTPYDGGPAFPGACTDGMSYRMWLVGLAMQGMLANDTPDRIGERALRYADEVIAAQGVEDPRPRESP